MGVEIQHEFVYPLEDAFAVYLSDYFDNSLFVIQGRHHPARVNPRPKKN